VSAKPQPFNGELFPAPDLIDRIANALPEGLRADYYRELSHCRALPESDEMLRILRAMQFLVVLIDRAPGQVAMERQHLAEILEGAIESIQTSHQATITYQKQLEARLAKLPQEIAKGIDAEAIAAKSSESLRQQYQETGVPAIAEAMNVQAATFRNTTKALSAVVSELAHPQNGAVPRVSEALLRMRTNVENAANHVRVQMNGLEKQLWSSIAILCGATLMIGFLLGMLYHGWVSPPVQLAMPNIKSTPESSISPQPQRNRNTRSQQLSPSRYSKSNQQKTVFKKLCPMRRIMGKLKLTVNETKTRVCKLPEEKFDFLGYTFGRCYSPKTGRTYLGTVPSKKRVKRICDAISNETGRNTTLLDPAIVVGKLNRMLNGWANYFCLGPVSKAYRAVEQHACKRLRQWLCAKHKVRGWVPGSFRPSTSTMC